MPTRTQKLSLTLLALVAFAYFALFDNGVGHVRHIGAKNRTLHVLYWTPMFSRPDFNLGLGQEIFQNCSHTNCLATNDREFLPVEDFDAILFHGVEYSERIFGKPERRKPRQIYVVSLQESPENTPGTLAEHKNFFNWTMSYRQDSDIFRPYGFFQKSNSVINYTPPSEEEVAKRPKSIAWMVSNCQTSSRREEMYRKLSKFFPIDVYGTCGTKKCAKSDADECYRMIENDYKFYLSFENSYCIDYVTEKLYNVLERNVVPIVLGGADYGRLAPPKSVINVADYPSFEKLVEHLKFLDRNPRKYLEYFEWKRHFVVDTSSQRTLCELCEKLNRPSIEPKVYPDIYRWWNGQNDNECINSRTNFR